MTAQGQMDIGTIVNPTIVRPIGTAPILKSHWDLEYALNSSVSLTSVTGDVSLYGNPGALYYAPALQGSSGQRKRLSPLP